MSGGVSPEPRPNRREMFAQLDRLQASLERIESYEIPAAVQQGPRQHRKAEAKKNQLDRAITDLFQQLHSPAFAGEQPNSLSCASGCGYVFADRRAKFKAVGCCPRCSGEGLRDPRDPNWTPILDQ